MPVGLTRHSFWWPDQSSGIDGGRRRNTLSETVSEDEIDNQVGSNIGVVCEYNLKGNNQQNSIAVMALLFKSKLYS